MFVQVSISSYWLYGLIARRARNLRSHVRMRCRCVALAKPLLKGCRKRYFWTSFSNPRIDCFRDMITNFKLSIPVNNTLATLRVNLDKTLQ